MRTERIGIRITEELKNKLIALAQAEHRNLSNYVEKTLTEHVGKNEND